jgi:predicted HicB family RNase H-like nuclease
MQLTIDCQCNRPDVHADIAAAAHNGKSINKWVVETLEQAIRSHE